LPSSQVGANTAVYVGGAFRVQADYYDDGTSQYKIIESNLKSSNLSDLTQTSNSTASVGSVRNTYSDVSTFDATRFGADHEGASISVNTTTGAISVTFQKDNIAYVTSGTNQQSNNDYNEISFQFTDAAIKDSNPDNDRGPRDIFLSGTLKEAYVASDGTTSSTGITSFTEAETGLSGSDAITAAASSNTVTYTIPANTQIGGTDGPFVSGTYDVKVQNNLDGTKTYSIVSSNIISTSSDKKYVNSYTDSGTIDATRLGTDHEGASISVNTSTGEISVTFQKDNSAYLTGTSQASTSDYNELSFSYTDTALTTADQVDNGVVRTLDLTGNLKEAYVASDGVSTTVTTGISSYTEVEKNINGNDTVTSSESGLSTITYTIPTNTFIGTSGVKLSGDFDVNVTYNADGTKSYAIARANLASTSADTKYVNSFTDEGTFNTTRSGTDHVGASIAVNTSTGEISVVLQNDNPATSGTTSTDYNEVSFSFVDNIHDDIISNDARSGKTVYLTGNLKETYVASDGASVGTLTSGISSYTESETGANPSDSLTSTSSSVVESIKYTLPANTQIDPDAGGTGPSISGDFTVGVTYASDGTKSYSIASANLSSTSSNDQVVTTFDDVSTFDTSRLNKDHVGSSLSLNTSTGEVTVAFENDNTAYTTGGKNPNQVSSSDYDNLSFSFKDPDAVAGTIRGGTQSLELTGDFKETYIGSDGTTATTSVVSYSERETDDINQDTITAACYGGGTLIQTSLGLVAVEHLSTGDLVLTVDGEHKPIIWIGSSKIDCSRQTHQEKAYPIRIAKGALAENLPQRDLYLSPDHSLLIDGVMIPAYCLVNEISITQDRSKNLVTYYHVELPKHEAIYAEGVPAESYLETSELNRQFFRNTTGQNSDSKVFELDLQYPACPADTPAWKHIWDTQGYAPLTQSGPILEAVQKRLLERAQQLSQGAEKAA